MMKVNVIKLQSQKNDHISNMFLYDKNKRRAVAKIIDNCTFKHDENRVSSGKNIIPDKVFVTFRQTYE